MLAASPEDSIAAKMTALRIIGERRLPGFHDDLTRIANAPAGEHTLVRMAAIAAIARFGDPADLPLLESLDRSDPRLATAIDHAIASLPPSP
jgi:HEAT repeat protein